MQPLVPPYLNLLGLHLLESLALTALDVANILEETLSTLEPLLC